jgi:amino acid adenylation domain-containing protein
LTATAEAALALPLTPEQQKLFTYHKLYPGDPSFNGPLVYRIRGAADPVRLQQAVQEVLRASRGLNTVFADTPQGPVARDDRHRDYTVPLIAVVGEREVVEAVREVVDTPLPPDRWPLYDVRVWRAPEAVYLSIVFAHLVGDVTGLWSLFRWITLAYEDIEAFRARAGELLDSPNTFTAEPTAPGAVEFFREQVGDLGSLAADWLRAPRTDVGSLEGEIVSTACGPELDARLAQGLAASGASPFAFFLAAHLVLLSRLTGESRVTVGVPLANRFGRRRRNAVGFFVNTLPLSFELADFGSFSELATEVELRTLRLLRYQDFDLTAHAAQVFAGQRPAMLAVDNAFTYYKQALGFTLDGRPVEWVDVPRRFVKYPLSITVENAEGTFRIIADVAHTIAASRPVECYRTILGQVADRPDRTLDSITLLDRAGRRRVDELLNERRHVDPGPSLAETLAEVARRQPDRPAVTDERGTLTYAELVARAAQVGRWLAAHVPEGHVAVSGPRDRELIVGIFGVLFAGKAYVPLDPAAPSGRTEHIAGRFSQLPLLRTGPVTLTLPGSRVIDLVDAERLNGVVPGPAPVADLDDTAYVIFTSGSTGKPKGVEVTQRGLLRLFAGTRELYGFGPADTWVLFHSHAFDFAVWEMFGALLSGGELVVPSSSVARSAGDFRALLIRHGVTVLNQTPSAFGQLLKVLRPEDRDALAVRHLFVGGEAVNFRTLLPWFDLLGARCRVHDIYGPTEGSVWVTHHEISRREAESERDSIIGRPLPDVALHVVDERLQPVPVGVGGELLIGGAAPGRGYLGNPEATAKAFVTGPDGDRAYRTGDVVRLRPDGVLAFVGRRDRQVQLRGYRVELGEVQSALTAVPGVRDAYVTAADDRLVGYIVAPADVTPRLVREAVKGLVPAYMVPSFLIALPELPLTVNGKVDEKALPPPPVLETAAAPAAAAGGSTAEQVAGIWRAVIGAAEVDPDENFFDIGGTSLHVTEVHRRLTETFDLPGLAMVDLFDHTTVRALAAHVDQRRDQRGGARPAPAAVRGRVRVAGAARRGRTSRRG